MVIALERETFVHKGKRWTRLPEKPYDMWIVGCDLGARRDYTAICALHHTREPTDEWLPNERTGQLKQKVIERFAVRGLRRLPLEMDYSQQVVRVRELMLGPPLHGQADLVLDDTGVGAAVGDIFVNDGKLNPVRITIHAGNEPTRLGYRRYGVPKIDLISNVDARLHTGELVFADDLPEREALKDELQNFQRHVTAAQRVTFEARGSTHDDIVLAVSLSTWWALQKRRVNQGSVGPLRGLW